MYHEYAYQTNFIRLVEVVFILYNTGHSAYII